VLLFEDETGLSLDPKLGRVWGKRGTRSYIYTKRHHHKRLNLFGWVDPLHGWHGIMKAVRGNTDGFLKMLTRIISRFKGVIVDLWVDNASWHSREDGDPRKSGSCVNVFKTLTIIGGIYFECEYGGKQEINLLTILVRGPLKGRNPASVTMPRTERGGGDVCP
jgi:hypothetical protein